MARCSGQIVTNGFQMWIACANVAVGLNVCASESQFIILDVQDTIYWVTKIGWTHKLQFESITGPLLRKLVTSWIIVRFFFPNNITVGYESVGKKWTIKNLSYTTWKKKQRPYVALSHVEMKESMLSFVSSSLF